MNATGNGQTIISGSAPAGASWRGRNLDDHLECENDTMFDSFAFTREVGRRFSISSPKSCANGWGRHLPRPKAGAAHLARALCRIQPGHDRGTTFGLKTGGNVDAILMSLPPEVVWE